MSPTEASTVDRKNWTTLQSKLYSKAKREPAFRFYSLADKAFSSLSLSKAYEKSRLNAGTAGVDRMTFEDIEKQGEALFLDELGESLRDKTYRPAAVRLVQIEEYFKIRPLGIPTIQDRVAQGAVAQLLEPIFEADFLECSYAYRPNRNAGQAVRDVVSAIELGFATVYHLDIKSFFDSIPHDCVMLEAGKRIADGTILGLIRGWLEAPLATRRGLRPRLSGTSQGGVISPLLANVVLNRFDQDCVRGFQDIRLIRYADDIWILSRTRDERITTWAREAMSSLGLTLNEEKTGLSECAAGQSVCVLGFRVSRKGDEYSLSLSDKALRKAKEKIDGIISRGSQDSLEVTQQNLRLYLSGWMNYFNLATERDSLFLVRDHMVEQLRRAFPGLSTKPMEEHFASLLSKDSTR